MVKVVKFGGSSLADATQFKKVADIIKSDESRKYVVASAPGKRFKEDVKVTDLFYQCHKVAGDEAKFEEVFVKIENRYNQIISDLNLSLSLQEEFQKIREKLKGDVAADYAASRGEYLNSIILASYLGYKFVDAAEIIFFDDTNEFDAEKTAKAIHKKLSKIERAVIPGFYGSLANGEIKTFSRGGSDVTGSIVSSGIQADLYENWTDVSGIMMADPRIVENPKVIPVITYRELRELSYMGASVLHEDAVFPVRKAGIPINVRNTNSPEDKGTMIVESTAYKPLNAITGIAGKTGFAVVNIEKNRLNSELGFIRKVLEAFEKNDVLVEHVPSGIDTMSVVVNQNSFQTCEQQVLSLIHRTVEPDHIEIDTDLALIAVVGRGMRATRGIAGRVFAALAHANINIRMIDQGSSELNIIIAIEEADYEQATKVIYNMFIES